jgi:G:T-mismatch repair DNA endonuclease (very short patch repair protein)
VVEYNNVIWHPRSKGDSVFYKYESKNAYDKQKISEIEKLGFKVFVVWNDDNWNEKEMEILDYVRNH